MMGFFSDVIGTDLFLTEFDYDPFTLVIENVEPIGFKSITEIDVKQNINVEFTVWVRAYIHLLQT